MAPGLLPLHLGEFMRGGIGLRDLGISALLLASAFFALPHAWGEAYSSLEEKLGIVELETELACEKESVGDARAALAYLAYSRAKSLGEQVAREVGELHRFLDSPEEIAQRQIQEDLLKARARNRSLAATTLSDEVWAWEYLKLRQRLGYANSHAVEAQRQRIREAKQTVDFYERSDAIREKIFPQEQLRQLTALRVQDAIKSLKTLNAIGRRADLATGRAWGCWSVAAGKARSAESVAETGARAESSPAQATPPSQAR